VSGIKDAGFLNNGFRPGDLWDISSVNSGNVTGLFEFSFEHKKDFSTISRFSRFFRLSKIPTDAGSTAIHLLYCQSSKGIVDLDLL